MKKLTLLIAALVLSFTVQAKVINAVPEGDIAYYLSIAESGDIIELADGVYDEEAILTFSVNGLVVKAAEGANPVIQTVGKWMAMNVEAATTFEGIVFDAEAGTNGDNQYGFNISANTTFNNCKFQDYTKYAVTLLAGTTTFDNCVFDGAGVTPSAIVIDGTIAECSIENSEFKNYKDYNIFVEDNTTIATLTIDQCVFDGANTESVRTTKAALFTEGIVSTSNIQDSEFKNFAECVATVDKWYGGRYDALTINNCLIHDCTQSAIYLPYAINENAKQTCSDFKLTNSTIYNIGNGESFGTIDIQDNTNIASEQQVLVDHVTIYNFLNSGWHGAIKVEESANAVVSNCIVMNTVQEWANPYKLFTGAQIKNSLYYNTEYADNGATTTNLVEADPMFVDAANADFMLYAESPAVGAGTGGSNLGDPRWGVKAGIQPGEGKLKAAVDAAQPGDVIVLGDETYEVSSSISCDVEGLTIKAAEGTKPIISFTGTWSSLKLSATTTFEGIIFDGGNVVNYPITTEGENTGIFTFNNCVFKNYLYYAISNNNATTKTNINSIIVNNCTFHDGGSAIYMNNQAACANITIQNTTIYNIAGADIYKAAIHLAETVNDPTFATQTLIDHLTIYNIQTSASEGAITIANASKTTISNCIIASPEQKHIDSYNVPAGATIQNCLVHNQHLDDVWNSIITKADPLFVDAANANFMLSANSPAVGAGTDGSNLGDTRWGVSASLKGKVINIEPGKQTLAAAVGYSVSPGDTIVLKDGTYEEPYSVNFDVEGLVVMAAEGAKPVIANASEWACLELSASTTFDGITFDAGNVAHYIIASKGAASGKFAFVNCEFKGWTTWAISNQYEAGTHVDSVIVDNCLFHDGLGGAISFSGSAPENQQSCQYFKMTNTTLYNLTESSYRGIINVGSNPEEEGKYNEVVIDHITMYNYELTESGIAAIAVRKSTDLKITNSIIANPEDKGYTALNVYGGTVDNTIHYNGSKRSGNTVYTKCENIDPLFVDAANNNFMLQANSPAIGKATDGSNLGDPRWGVAEPELITLTTGDNSAVIAANIGKTVNVKIERSFTANDGYYTLCVPFNMDPSVIGKAYSLGTITEHVSGEGININLEEESELSTGVPYLVLPKANMSELVVENVTIQSDIASGQNVTNKEETVKIFFEGFYSAPGRTTNGTTEYYVGNDGYLYKGEVEIRGLCGLFTITDANNNPLNVRARVVTREEVETGLDNNQLPNTNIQKVLENGQLIIIRDGVKYNVQGQVIK